MEQYLSAPVIAGIYLFAFVLGCCIFSFLNVVIYRTPRHISFVKGRSFCPACGHTLAAWDLVPVASWLFLRGKCRYCKAPVSGRYMGIELLGGAGACLCLARFGLSWGCAAAFLFLAVGTLIAFVDIDTMEIPDGFHLVLLLLSAVFLPAFPEVGLLQRIIGIFCVSIPMLVLALLIPGAFGGGDIKLMAAAGFLLGWKGTLLGFFFAVLAGGLYAIWLLAGKKKGRKDQFAFGPFLCLGLMISLLWGNEILAWYLGMLGL